MTEGTTMKVPPTELQQTIDKTVKYVVKNDRASFEQRLKENNKDGKFDFLIEGNEYNEYYLWKVQLEKIDETPVETEVAATNFSAPDPLDFITTLPTISKLDLEIIKTTAIYAARNGPGYLNKLIKHQKLKGNQAQFEFTNKTHSFYQLFYQYITQYRIVIDLIQNKNDKLLEKISNPDNLLKNASHRAEYNKHHKQQVKATKQLKKEKQLFYASIDWQDFAIIGKIEFDAIDQVQELPLPISRDSLLYRSLDSKLRDVIPKPTETKSETPQKPSQTIKGMKVKAAGESRLKKTTNNTKTIKCPITGQLIEELKFDQHLKVLLRDPRYKQQQENYLKKNFSYSSNLSTDQVYDNIKRLMKKRGADNVQPSNKRIA